MRIYFTIASISILCLAVFIKYFSPKWTPSASTNSTPSITGMDIYDMDLCDISNITPAVITNLTSLMYEHGYIILKKQCKQTHHKISAETLEFIAKQFGEPTVYGASIKESKFITMLTNNGSIGQKITGSEGWHIDGTMHSKPNSFCLMYVQNAPNINTGGTRFMHTTYFLDEMQSKNPATYELWNRLFFCTAGNSLHPVVALHPITNKHHMIMHTSYTKQVIEVMDISMMKQINDEFKGKSFYSPAIRALMRAYNETNTIRIYSAAERKELLKSMTKYIEESEFMHVTSYEDGDLLIRDNLVMIHIADPSARLPVEQIGLRNIWRIALKGVHFTSKY